MHNRLIARLIGIVTAALVAPAALSYPTPLGNSLTYQGQLKQSGSPVNGGFDFECKLFDALNAGTQIGSTQSPANVQVSDGLFTLDLDFGVAAFDGNDRFLEIGVRSTGGGAFTTLSPRQKLTAAPYAQFAKSASIGGTIGSQVNLTNAANSFTGNGANLTGLNASNINSGTIGGGLLSGSYSNALTLNNAANIFTGNGAGLTALNASNLISGTVPGARLAGSYSNAMTMGNIANSFTGNGAGLTGLNASNITTGSLGAGLLPTGGNWALTSALNIDANTMVLDPVNNRVGIGTAAPTASLHLSDPSLSTLLVDRTGGSQFQIAAQSTIARMGTINAFPLRFTTGGNDRMTIDTTGAVGIGTTVPAADLHIRGAAGLGSLAISPTSSNSNSQIILAEESTATTGMVIRHDGNVNRMDVFARLSGVDQTPVLSISRSATPLIGIGTTTPLAALHVQEGSAGTIVPAATASLILERSNHNYIQMYAPDANETGILFGGDAVDVDGGIVFNNASVTDGLSFRAGGNSTKMVITSVGDVGVGTIAPDSKFHVAGGTDATLAGGGYIMAGSPTNINVVIDNNEIMARNNGATSTLFLNNDGGDVSISPNGTGRLITPVIEITGADLAEEFPFSEPAEPGSVVAIDPANPGKLCVAKGAYNRCVAGIIAGANDFHTGAVLGRHTGEGHGHAVALNGRVYVRATNANGVIQPGDFLTTSDTPGNAMKATDGDRMQGAIIGKAMTAVDVRNGMVLVLVNLH